MFLYLILNKSNYRKSQLKLKLNPIGCNLVTNLGMLKFMLCQKEILIKFALKLRKL